MILRYYYQLLFVVDMYIEPTDEHQQRSLSKGVRKVGKIDVQLAEAPTGGYYIMSDDYSRRRC